MSTIRSWPARIWLQRPEGGLYAEHAEGEVTWCRDKINQEDVEYVRIDLFNSLRVQLKKRTAVSEDVARP